MKVVVSAKFDKDLDKITDSTTLERIESVLLGVIAAKKVVDIVNIKKMKGAKNAFRIRVGDYRIGIFIERDTVKFARIALRKDIYDIFP